MRASTAAVTFLIALVTAPAGAQMCPGDNNRDQMTTVDEIVAAVDSALNGCPANLGCPLHFDEVTPENETCYYVGRWHPLCGPSDLEAFFFNDGEGLIISFINPDIDFFADVIDDGIAELFAWEDLDSSEGLIAVEGEALLSDPPREALTVYPLEIPFDIDDCPFERYEGRFLEYEALLFSSARSRFQERAARSRERLRALRNDPSFLRLQSEARERRKSR